MANGIVTRPLPALNKKAIGRRFKRLVWGTSDSFSFTKDGYNWRFGSSGGMEGELCDENKIAEDWYEIDSNGVEFTIAEDVGIEEIIFPGESICYLGLTDNQVKTYNKEKETKMEKEAVEVFTDLEKRTKFTGELYGPDGKGRGILAFDKKCDAKKILGAPENLGCYIVLRKEVAVYTTAIPVVKVEGV